MCNLRGVNLSGNCMTNVIPKLNQWQPCSPTFLKLCLLAASLTTKMLRFLPVRGTSLSSDVHSRWTRCRTTWRDSDVRISLSVSYLPWLPFFAYILHSPPCCYQSPFSHHLRGRGARWTVCLLASSYHYVEVVREERRGNEG